MSEPAEILLGDINKAAAIIYPADMPCSHDFRDVRYQNQLVFNWSVAPWSDPKAPNDGAPRRYMQYGQSYECNRCGITITLPDAPA